LDEKSSRKLKIAVVLISRESDKAPIKRKLDQMGIRSQFLLFKNIQKKVGVKGVITNLLR